MPVQIALLRGINVGGKNLLAMKDLSAMFLAAGCTDVRTYIQSGNVIFQADKALAERIPSLIEAEILRSKKLHVPVIVRSAAVLGKTARKNPFAKSKPDHLYVGFLAQKPAPAAVALLDAKRSPPDEFKVLGSEVFLNLPGGAGKTRLTNQYFDSVLKTTMTVRNWNTVQKLLELCSER